jgi:hypothetical protein
MTVRDSFTHPHSHTHTHTKNSYKRNLSVKRLGLVQICAPSTPPPTAPSMVNGECISNRIHDRPRCEKSDLLTTCVGAIALSPARATKLGLFLRVLAPHTLLAQDWERSEDEESKGGREARMRRKPSRNLSAPTHLSAWLQQHLGTLQHTSFKYIGCSNTPLSKAGEGYRSGRRVRVIEGGGGGGERRRRWDAPPV